MAIDYTLNKRHILAGQYVGILRTKSKIDQIPAMEMIHLGNVVGNVVVTPEGKDGDAWDVRADIPTDFLVDGVQTFLLVMEGQTEILDQFSMVTGEPLEQDLRAEIQLLREELDMVKRAFRRHCIETMNG